MPTHELRADSQLQAARFRTGLPNHISNRRVLAMGRRNGPAEQGLEEILSSAVQTADNELKRAGRKAQSLLLLYCDVDNLKNINDSYGHQEGDLALIRTADALEQAFRDSDILARLGGDEFVVLAPEASDQTQEVLLPRLEKTLKKSNAGESRYQLSLSVGVARFDPKRAVSLGELMAQADEAMYEQKRNHQKFCKGHALTVQSGPRSRKRKLRKPSWSHAS